MIIPDPEGGERVGIDVGSSAPVGRLGAANEAGVIRIVIVSDVRLYADGLTEILGRNPRLEVVSAVANPDESLDHVAALRPDVVLVDMGRKASGDAIRGIRTRVGAEVVALAVTETEEEILDYARAGASGYVARGASLNELVSTVESVSRGEILCSPRIAAALFKRAGALANDSRAPLHRLTRRETEIVGLVARGLSNKQIAQRLFIEVATVKNHLHNIFEKLQVRSRIEAVMVYQASSRTPR